MVGRALNFAAILSSLLLGGVLLLWVNADAIDPWQHRISIGPRIHLSIFNFGRADTRLAIFNDPGYGPYHGSILNIGEDSTLDHTKWFGDAAGIYFRYFHWTDGGELWSLLVSLAYPAAAFAILPAVWLFQRKRAQSAKRVGQAPQP